MVNQTPEASRINWPVLVLLLVVIGLMWSSRSGKGKPGTEPEAEPIAKVVDEVTGIEVDGETVIMLSMEGCSWCKKWIAEEQGKFESVSIKTYVRDDVQRPGYPVFRLYNGSSWREHVGFMTFEEYRNGELQGLGSPDRVTLVSAVKAEPPKAVEPLKPAPAVTPTAKPANAAQPVKAASSPAPASKPVSAVVSVDPVSGFHCSKPTVIVLSTEGCGPCLTWEQNVAPTVQSKGVDVFSTKAIVQKSYPTFRIYDGKGKWHMRSGSKTSASEILGLIGK